MIPRTTRHSTDRSHAPGVWKERESILMQVLAYCRMPNHFDLALWPYYDGDLSRWMHSLPTTYVRQTANPTSRA
jgi:hypothetical protein